MPRRPGLDTAVVVEAAARLIDAEGVEALSLSRLATQLGIRTPSLYNHIDGLPGLQLALARRNAAVLAERLGNAAIGKSGGEAVRSVAQAFRDYIKSAPGVYTVATRRLPGQTQADTTLEQAESRVVEIVLAVVSSYGLEGEEALHAVRGLRSLVHGFATLETAGGFGLPLDLDESFRRLVDVFIAGLECSA